MYCCWVERRETRGWERVCDLLLWSCPSAWTPPWPHPTGALKPFALRMGQRDFTPPAKAFALWAAAPALFPQPSLHHLLQLSQPLGGFEDGIMFLLFSRLSHFCHQHEQPGERPVLTQQDIIYLSRKMIPEFQLRAQAGRGTSGGQPCSFTSFLGLVPITEATLHLRIHGFAS